MGTTSSGSCQVFWTWSNGTFTTFNPPEPTQARYLPGIRHQRRPVEQPEPCGELVKKRIEADIDRDLTAKGLAMGPGPADLNVRYTFGAAREMKAEAYPAGWRGWGTRVVRVPYAEGTLVIDLLDATTHSLVWRAIATVEKSDAMKVEGKIDAMVGKSLKKYPPKP